MELSRALCEKEIAGSEAALKAHREGVLVHELVIKAFRDALIKLPKEKKE